MMRTNRHTGSYGSAHSAARLLGNSAHCCAAARFCASLRCDQWKARSSPPV